MMPALAPLKGAPSRRSPPFRVAEEEPRRSKPAWAISSSVHRDVHESLQPQPDPEPTGAAIVKTLSHGILQHESILTQAIGYGAGSREIKQVPNLLRVVIGEMAPRYDEDEIAIVETNIDDMNPEIYPYVIEKLLASGAYDAYLVPILMKKGRPGILLSVMVQPGRLDDIVKVIYNETSTIGLRIKRTGRIKLQRRQAEVVTSFGKVTVKVLVHDGKERLAPEFEECKRLAIEHNLPLKDVYEMIQKELSEHSK